MPTPARPMLLAALGLLLVGCDETDDDPVDPGDPETTGRVIVDAAPDVLDAPWVLTGPDGYRHDGQGDETIDDLPAGDYGVEWGDVAGWTTPASQTQTLEPGLTITFGAEYVNAAGAGTVVVDPSPDGLAAPWLLEGPLDYETAGDGDQTIGDLPPGDYQLTWIELPGWLPPPSEVQALAAGDTVIFAGDYEMEAAAAAPPRGR